MFIYNTNVQLLQYLFIITQSTNIWYVQSHINHSLQSQKLHS